MIQTPERSGLPAKSRGAGREGTFALFLITCASRAGSSPAVVPLTVSVSLTFRSKILPPSSATSWLIRWNAQHGITIENSYDPAARPAIEYRPSALLVVRATAPVALFVNWMGASATAAPFGSETTPATELRLCADRDPMKA